MKMSFLVVSLVFVLGATRHDASHHYPYVLAHHATSTKSSAAQLCFDRGLTLYYAYNRLASQRAFECAVRADPTFAMGYWGIALAHGPNINVTISASDEKAAYAAIHRAIALQLHAAPEERAYIAALSMHYTNAGKPDLAALAFAYSNSMKNVVARYPNDLEAANLYAESEMDLQSWEWYANDGTPIARTNAIRKTIDSVLARDPENIGANHLNVHMSEESLHPQSGLASADRLRGMKFEPAAAHLVHMPAHTYMRTGDFASAAAVNEDASAHDLAYMREAHEADPEFLVDYHLHNLTMLAVAYANEGSWNGANRAAAMLEKSGMHVPALFVDLRFSRFNEILAIPKPVADNNEPLRIPLWHFARGMAFASRHRLSDAEAELALVREAKKSLRVPATAGINNSSDSILGMAGDFLTAKIAGVRGRRDDQIDTLRSAVALEDTFVYVEPRDWYAPARESLGGVLLQSGDYRAAAAAFQEDLHRNAGNPRSLFGLYRSLAKLGDSAQASNVRTQFDVAWKNADTPLSAEDL
jgi:hypothetical protein